MSNQIIYSCKYLFSDFKKFSDFQKISNLKKIQHFIKKHIFKTGFKNAKDFDIRTDRGTN